MALETATKMNHESTPVTNKRSIKLSDTFIANKLNISSQAIGKIRRKLESEVIKKYTVELDHSKIGLGVCVIMKIHIDGEREIKEKVVSKLIEIPHTIAVFELFGSSYPYIIVSSFKDVAEFKDFMEKEEKSQEIFQYIKISEIYEIPCRNVLKFSKADLFHKYIEDLGTKHNHLNFGSRKL